MLLVNKEHVFIFIIISWIENKNTSTYHKNIDEYSWDKNRLTSQDPNIIKEDDGWDNDKNTQIPSITIH